MTVISRKNLPGLVSGGQTQTVSLSEAKGLESVPRIKYSPLRFAQGDKLLLAVLLLFAFPGSVDAHDIPTTVLLRVFIKPDQDTLRLIVRAPLEAMRDINFPMRDSNRYLDIPRAEPLLRDAAVTWLANAIQMYEDDSLLTRSRIAATRISLPSDRSFASYAEAVEHLHAAPLAANIDLPWRQAMLDVEIDFPIRSASSRFSISPTLARLGVRTTTILRFIPPGGDERALEYVGDPGVVRLDPRWYQAAGTFMQLGFFHIWSGIDHLLFIFCLVIPFRRIRPLIGVVTAFTVAHSITLIASASGHAPGGLWFPPLIEVLIALSILYMALENIILFASPNGTTARLERRWIVAFLFGLVHGFGFSFALRESLQFSGSHLVTSLLSFNVGVELGQITVLMIAIPVLTLLFHHVVTERVGVIILSAFVAHTAWHWLADRWTTLRLYPGVDVAALRWVAGVALMAGIVAVIYRVARPGAAYEPIPSHLNTEYTDRAEVHGKP